jgi:hypothetical protein
MSLAAFALGCSRRLPWLAFLGLGLLLAGCSHYQLGTGTSAKFTTLFIAPVASTALIPQAQSVVTTQIRDAFLKDGRVRLVNSAAEADAVLTLTLVRYERTLAVSLPTDTGLGRRFDITLEARATLSDQRGSAVYFTDRPLVAKRGAFADSGSVPAEYQLLPLLAEQLAGEAVHAALDVW